MASATPHLHDEHAGLAGHGTVVGHDGVVPVAAEGHNLRSDGSE